MDFMTAVKTCLGKYVTFQGRASRSEFWFFALFIFLGGLVASVLDALVGMGLVYLLFALGTLLPNIAVAVRRLHDLDRSGWWYLLLFVPIVGVIVLLIWFCGKGTNGGNRFGDDPLAGKATAAAATI